MVKSKKADTNGLKTKNYTNELENIDKIIKVLTEKIQKDNLKPDQLISISKEIRELIKQKQELEELKKKNTISADLELAKKIREDPELSELANKILEKREGVWEKSS
jgi:hypothetical protein